MLFNSYTFVAFFLVVLAVSRGIASWPARKAFLLAGSYLFYAAWNPPFVVLLWISTIADWHFAQTIHRSHRPAVRKLNLLLSLAVNLGMLAFFKYGNFLLDNLVWLAHSLGIPFQPAAMNIVLPVGISFYTFQTLSYTFDIYRGKARPWHSFLDYALYVTFFPQLVAGPIVRAVDFLPQCRQSKTASSAQLGWGLTLMVIGLFHKMVIADTFLSPVAETVFDSNRPCGLVQAWTGVLAFSGQIFCDFAGYSTCAIGAALCLGFALPDNFRFPYAAIGFSDFWRRWHISLSSWLRDYLYITLGGNRKGPVRTYANLMITMLLGGLWHGASWLFVIWGGLHGMLLILERLLLKGPWARWPLWHTTAARLALAGLTYLCVCFVWVFFRAGQLSRAGEIVRAMVDIRHLTVRYDTAFLMRTDYYAVAVISLALVAIHWFMRDTTVEAVAAKLHWTVRTAGLVVMILLILLSFSGEDRAFIYFQF